jgi:hypothetical protein
MTRKLDLTARQVTALCKGAARAGYIPIVKIGDVSIQLVPEDKAPALDTAEAELDKELGEWERSLENRPTLPLLNKTTVLSRSDREQSRRGVSETPEQRAARHAKIIAQWEADLPNSDLDHREQRVMEQLTSGPDEPWDVSTIALAGPATLERLTMRGFIKVDQSATGAIATVTLMKSGRKAFAEIERMRGGHGYF